MRLAALVAPVLFAAACGEVPAPAPPPTGDAVAESPAPRVRHADPRPPDELPRLRDDRGGWDPPPSALVRAARLSGSSEDEVDEFLEGLSAAERIETLRAALRLEDDRAARRAATRLAWEELDEWELARATELLAADALAPDGDTSADSLFETMRSAELPAFLDRLAETDEASWAGALGALHKAARADHLVHLPRLAPLLREETRSVFGTTIGLTDRHAEAVAAAALGLTPAEAAERYPAAAGRLPALLVALLRDRLVTEPRIDSVTHFAWRWLGRSAAGPDDAPFLLELDSARPQELGLLPDHVPWMLARAGAGEALRAIAERRGPEGRTASLLGALAMCGDEVALVELEEEARDSALHLAALLHAAPQRGRALVTAVALRDGHVGWLDVVRAAWEEAPGPYGIPFDEGVFDGFAAEARAAGVDGAALLYVGLCVPGARTREVALRGAEGLDPAELLDEPFAERVEELLAIAETGARDALVAEARKWASRAAPDARDLGLEILLRLRDVESDADLVPWAAARLDEEGRLGGDHAAPFAVELGRLGTQRARAALEAAAARDGEEALLAVEGLAVLHGLPEETDWKYLAVTLREDAPDAFRSLLDGIRGGRPAEALLAAMRTRPDVPVDGLGLVRTEAVRERLRDVRARRELRMWAWATGELALSGDPDAHRDAERLLEGGHYRFGDEMSMESRTLGLAPPEAFVRWWLPRLETNCCQTVAARTCMERWFGFDPTTWAGDAVTQYSEARRFLDRARGRFSHSRLAGRWVPECR